MTSLLHSYTIAYSFLSNIAVYTKYFKRYIQQIQLMNEACTLSFKNQHSAQYLAEMLCPQFPTTWSEALTVENFECRKTDDIVQLNIILHTDMYTILGPAQHQILLFSITGVLSINTGMLYCCVCFLCCVKTQHIKSTYPLYILICKNKKKK